MTGTGLGERGWEQRPWGAPGALAAGPRILVCRDGRGQGCRLGAPGSLGPFALAWSVDWGTGPGTGGALEL